MAARHAQAVAQREREVIAVKIGDSVVKVARRNHRGSAVLGVVVELFERDGKAWARIASGAKRDVFSAWPCRQLKPVNEEL